MLDNPAASERRHQNPSQNRKQIAATSANLVASKPQSTSTATDVAHPRSQRNVAFNIESNVPFAISSSGSIIDHLITDLLSFGVNFSKL